MSLTQDNIVDLANTIGGTTGSTVSMNIYYDEIMQGLATRFNPPLVETTVFTVSSGTASYSWPSTASSILAIFSSGRQILPVTRYELDAYDDGWRASTSTDSYHFYYTGEDTQRSFRLYPIPSTASTGTLIMGVASSDDVPDYMGLYIACEILKREFAKPSEHQDKQFAKAAGDVAGLFGMLIGVV
jgi:hypothetical protein